MAIYYLPSTLRNRPLPLTSWVAWTYLHGTPSLPNELWVYVLDSILYLMVDTTIFFMFITTRRHAVVYRLCKS